MKNKNQQPFYFVSQDDAFRIEALISTLAMAVWEILEQGKMTPEPPSDESDADIAERTFLQETKTILSKRTEHDF